MEASTFHLVVFEEEQSTAVVPNLWLKGLTQCYWPPYKTSLRINNAAQKKEIPGEAWTVHPVRVLFRGSWEDCRSKLKKSEETSDLQSDAEPPSKRQKCAPKRFVDEEESDDTDSMDNTESQSPSCGPEASFDYPRPPTPLNIRDSVSIRPSTSTPSRPGVTPGIRDRIQEARDARHFAAMESIKEQLRELTRMVRILIARGTSLDDMPGELPDGLVFPVKTEEELVQLEDRLADQQTSSAVVKYLSEFGGSNIHETVSRCLRAILSTNVARLYNFKGTKGKKRFEDLRLTNVLYRSLHMNAATRSSSRKDLELGITKWLSGSRDRDGGRKSRDGQNNNGQNNNTD